MVYWTRYCGGSIAGWFVYESLLCCEVNYFLFLYLFQLSMPRNNHKRQTDELNKI
jgi:hypothetical protein